MARPEARRMNFEDFAADLNRVFEALVPEDSQVLIEKAGKVYRVELEEAAEAKSLWANYDPDRAREALQRSAGAFAGVNTKELIADIHAARQQRSRGRPA